MVYLENERSAGAPDLPPHWELLKSKSAGEVGYHLARVNERAGNAKTANAQKNMPSILGPSIPSPTVTTTWCAVPPSIFDRLVVAIAANPNKAPMFTLEQRVDMARRVLADVHNVEVKGYVGLTVDFARQNGLAVIVRGLRAVSDFEFEFQLANMSRHLTPEIESVFMTPAGTIHIHLFDAGAGNRGAWAAMSPSSCIPSWRPN